MTFSSEAFFSSADPEDQGGASDGQEEGLGDGGPSEARGAAVEHLIKSEEVAKEKKARKSNRWFFFNV